MLLLLFCLQLPLKLLSWSFHSTKLGEVFVRWLQKREREEKLGVRAGARSGGGTMGIVALYVQHIFLGGRNYRAKPDDNDVM